MEVMIFQTPKEASQKAFEIWRDVFEKGAQTFGLATGSTPEKLYELISKSDMDLSQKYSINLDEYFGISPSDKESYHFFMHHHLFSHKPFAHSYLFDGENKNVEQELQLFRDFLKQHPIDLQILGVGNNGHIGFNEPGTSFLAESHLVDLTQDTIDANKRFFPSRDDVPKQAYTMGLGEIMQAKKILLLAFGEKKSTVIQKIIEGEMTPDIPASILQKHKDVIFLLDTQAASRLTKKY